ncbi:LacI family DNA-binding transcriptional regulator [Paenibacillus sepulcri]
MTKKITMQDIADHVGVSKFAVSKALSGKSGIKPETRDKIVQAAAQLGYRFITKEEPAAEEQPKAAAFGETDHRQVIVLVPNVRYQTRHSYYWGRIIEGVQLELEERGIGMILVTEHIRSQFANMINPRGVMGIIGVGVVSYQILLEIRNLGIPFVLIDHEDPLIPSDVLSMNNFEWMRRITHYLVGMGHRNLQFVGNLRYSRSFYDRWFGYRSMTEEHGLGVNQHEGLLTIRGDNRSEMTEALETILQELSRESRMPTAFACANDSIAMCVMTILARMNIRVPDEVSVTGFDDIKDAALSSPTLTTVHVHKRGMGVRAVEALLRRLEHPNSPKEKILLTGELVVRQSAGPKAAKA